MSMDSILKNYELPGRDQIVASFRWAADAFENGTIPDTDLYVILAGNFCQVTQANATRLIAANSQPETKLLPIDALAAATAAKTRNKNLIDGQKVWADLQKIGKADDSKQVKSGQWRHLAPLIKEFLARAGQAGAPGCRTEPNQADRKDRNSSGSCPRDGFTQEEVALILAMARKHRSRSPGAIQRKWAWSEIRPGSN